MKGRIAIVFQGNIRTDARVLRETISFSKEWNVDVYASHVQASDRALLPDQVRLFAFEMDTRWIYRNLFFWKQYKALLQRINPHDYDVILCIDYPTLQIGSELKRRNPLLKVWYDSHEIYIETINQFFPKTGWKQIYGRPLIAWNQWYHRIQEQKLVKQTDFIFTVCQSLKDYFEPRWRRKVEVLRNCPMEEHFVYDVKRVVTRAELGIRERDFLLIYQGDINPGRGLHFLIKVMRHLPSNFHLLIVGEGMLRRKLEIEAQDLNSIHFTGRVPYLQLQYYTRIADLGVNLIEPINDSKRLSLPNKLFEYMACGVPFLSNNLLEPRRIVNQYGTGIIVEMESAQAVAETIVQLEADEQIRQQMQAKALQTFRKELNWNVEFTNFTERLPD